MSARPRRATSAQGAPAAAGVTAAGRRPNPCGVYLWRSNAGPREVR